MKTPLLTQLDYNYVMGGKRPLWQARHPIHPGITGAGSRPELAGKDWQKQFRSRLKK